MNELTAPQEVAWGGVESTGQQIESQPCQADCEKMQWENLIRPVKMVRTLVIPGRGRRDYNRSSDADMRELETLFPIVYAQQPQTPPRFLRTPSSVRLLFVILAGVFCMRHLEWTEP